MASSTRVLVLIVFAQLFLGCSLVYARHAQNSNDGQWEPFGKGLSTDYYKYSCPSAEKIIKNFMIKAVREDSTFAAAALRLHFHDCFTHGCDGSVLIDSTKDNIAEKEALPNNGSLAGFAQIEELKSLLEAACPRVVSCADILAVAARDAVVEVGGESWPVAMGRKDGLVSSEVEANTTLPFPNFNHDQLVENFAAQGLNQKDLVVLSGAHTIGRAHCFILIATTRLYNSTQPGAVDGTDGDLNSKLAKSLKKQCPPSTRTSPSAGVFLDPTDGGQDFDTTFYSRLLEGKGLFRSDAALLKDTYSANLVKQYAKKSSPFDHDFGNSMIKMGNIPIPKGSKSNIRRKCNVFNKINAS